MRRPAGSVSPGDGTRTTPTSPNGTHTMATATMAQLWARLEVEPHIIPTEQHVLQAYQAGRYSNAEAKKMQDAVRLRNKRTTDAYLRKNGYDF